MAPFALVSDIEARWRSLSDTEKTRAHVLLDDASALIRAERPTIDALILAGTVGETVPRMISVAMVKRAMVGGEDAQGVQSQQQTAGPFSQQFTFTNPSGDLYLTRAEKRLLSGRRKGLAFSVDLMQPADDDTLTPAVEESA